MAQPLQRDRIPFRFSLYGFLKNQTYYEPFLILALREKGLSVKAFLKSVRDMIPQESPSARHLLGVLDEALIMDDEGRSLGLLLDQFLFGEVRRAVEEVLGVEVSNGNSK